MDKITIGTKQYKASELNLKLLKRFFGLQDVVAFVRDNASMVAAIDGVTGFVCDALRRDNPDITMEELEEAITFRAIPGIMQQFADLSGLVAPAPGELSSPSTGLTSTGT